MTGASARASSVSVIVATRNRRDSCQRLCAAIERQFLQHPDVQAEIVLVFDGCATYDWVPSGHPYRTLALDSWVGIARARNAGLRLTSGDVAAFLDDDCVPAPEWLSNLLHALEVHPELVAFGGRVVGTDQVNLYSQLRGWVYYYETFGPWYVDTAAEGDLPGPPYVNGGNCAYRRAALATAGGFDPILPAYSDVELGRRLNVRHQGILLAGMYIDHNHPATFHSYLQRCVRSGEARGLLWAHRHYPEDSPATVMRAIVANIVWNNVVHRRPRINASGARTVAVLFCQEVIHGFGYARSLVRAGWLRGGGPRGRPDGAARCRTGRDRPQQVLE